MPGQEFPVASNLNWKPLLSMGWIEKVSDEVPVPAPAQSARNVELPSDLSSLKKAELFDLAEELGIAKIEGTGSGGLITKADLVRAIKSHDNG
jgi:hypothetical protein